MLEAYAIGVTLRLHNLISPQLLELAKQFEKLEGLTVSLNKSLGKLSVDASGLRSLTTATNANAKAFEKADLTAAAYEKRLASLHKMSGSFQGLPMIGAPTRGAATGGGSGSAWGPGGRRGGGGAGGMHGGNIHMGAGGIGLGTVGMSAGDWFVPLAVTGAAIYAGHSLFESAKELDTERQKFRQFGLSERQNNEAFDFVKHMGVYGSTQIEQMAAFRESQGVFRESGLSGSAALAGAKLAAPVLAKLDFLASSLDEESAATMKTANLNMLRYVESSGGLKSAAEFNRLADFGYKLNVSSGGTVDWAQLRQFKARAGAAGFNLSDDAMARLEPTIAEMKGGATGFGLSTMFNRLTGAIRVPNQIAHMFVDSGFWDPSKVVFNKNGSISKFLGNPLGPERTQLLSTNPELFYEQMIRPIWQGMHLGMGDIARNNVMALGTTGGRNGTLWENQQAAIHRSVDSMAKTKGITESVDIAKGSLTGEQKEFEAAWTDFKTEFGTTMLPFFTGILKTGAEVLRAIGGRSHLAQGEHFVQGGFDSKTGQLTVAHWENGGNYVSPAGSGPALFDNNGNIAGSSSRFVAPPGGNTAMTATANIFMDGKKVGAGVINFMNDQARRSQTGPSTFDASMSLPPAGSGF